MAEGRNFCNRGMRRLALLAMVCVAGTSFGQREGMNESNHKLDSLFKLIDSAVGIEKYDLLIEASYVYWNMDNAAKTMELARKARGLAWAYGDSIRYVDGSKRVAQLLTFANARDDALALLDSTVDLARRHGRKKDLASMLDLIGSAFILRAEYDKALAHLLESLALCRDLADQAAVARRVNNVGVVHYKLKNYRKALHYFTESVTLRTEIGDVTDLDVAMTNAGLCYAYLGIDDSAVYFLDKALEVCGPDCPNGRLLQAQFGYGVVSFEMNHFDEAERWFSESYRLAIIEKDTRFQMDNILYLCQIEMEKNDHPLAEAYLKKAESLIEAGVTHNLEIIKVYKALSALKLIQGDYRAAANYQQKYIALRDSVYDEELTTNLMAIQAEFAERENRSKLEAQEAMLALNVEMIAGQRKLNIVVAFLALALFVLALALWKGYLNRKRVSLLLEKKVAERTREIEAAMHAFLMESREREQRMGKAQAVVRATLANVQGFCELGIKESSPAEVKKHLVELSRASADLSANVTAILGNKRDQSGQGMQLTAEG